MPSDKPTKRIAEEADDRAFREDWSALDWIKAIEVELNRWFEEV